jgi:hypothetical protein
MLHSLTRAAVLTALAWGGMATSPALLACTDKPPTPPATLWLDQGRVGIEVELFDITQPTVCVAGIGFDGAVIPSLDVTDAVVAVSNVSTGKFDPIPAFAPLATDPAATAGLSVFAPPGFNWFGFSGTINPFPPPPLDPGDVIKLWFEFDLNPADAAAFLTRNVLVAAGSDLPGFVPGNPTHPVDFFTAVDPLLGHAPQHVPEPAGIALLSLGLAGIGLTRRRRGAALPTG